MLKHLFEIRQSARFKDKKPFYAMMLQLYVIIVYRYARCSWMRLAS